MGFGTTLGGGTGSIYFGGAKIRNLPFKILVGN